MEELGCASICIKNIYVFLSAKEAQFFTGEIKWILEYGVFPLISYIAEIFYNKKYFLESSLQFSIKQNVAPLIRLLPNEIFSI